MREGAPRTPESAEGRDGENIEDASERLYDAYLGEHKLKMKLQELQNEIEVLSRKIPPGEVRRLIVRADADFEQSLSSEERRYWHSEEAK